MSSHGVVVMLNVSGYRQEVDVMRDVDDVERPKPLKTLAWVYEWALGAAVVFFVVLAWSNAAI
ncbi:MAG: hypothetical protein R3352_08250 [Salinisphaeraceae bacterium]|nr:hypothetical protein [Salinisphaeraceae bacterium]